MNTATETRQRTDSEMIFQIRAVRSTEKHWNDLTPDERREVLRQAGGDTWHLDEVIDGVIADRRMK